MRERKIPTILGLLLVIAVIVAFRFAFEKFSPYFSKAAPSDAPRDVVFTNITDTGFTVTWITDTYASGAVGFDGQKNTGLAFDERDVFTGDTSAKQAGE